jgi:hypothetical protein
MLVNVRGKSLAERRKELLEDNRGALAGASIRFGWVRRGHQARLEARMAAERRKVQQRRAQKAARAPITAEQIEQLRPAFEKNCLP